MRALLVERPYRAVPCRTSRESHIVAARFGCREQIAYLTGRRVLHLAQVLQMAMYEEQGAVRAPEDVTW